MPKLAERKRAIDQPIKTTPNVPSTLSLTREQIATIIDDLGDLVTALTDANPTTSSRSTELSS